jgi:glycogen(starch) synthase
MKVLMTTDAIGGVWTYADDLRGALGCEVVLAVVGPIAPPGEAHLPGRLEWQPDPWDDVRAAGEWLLELAEEHAVDVVHLNQLAFGALDWPCPAVVVGHSDVLSWHEAVHGAPAGPAWGRYAAEVTAGLRGADAVIAPTRAMAAALGRHYGVDAHVIANGVAPGPPAADPKEPVVLAAGRLWDAAKGLDVLDAVVSPWPVEVAGERGAARRVRLLGQLPRDGLRERMARAAVFAHPARYEPSGLAPLEAAQAGCALVLGDIPSLRELWDGAALFVAPGDPAALGDALDRVAADAGARHRLAAIASARAGPRTAQRMAAEYEHLYARLTARGEVSA